MPRALVKLPSDRFAHGLTSQDLGQPDVNLAGTQHLHYRSALESLGFELMILAADDSPDSCFVEDMAVVAVDSRGGSGGLLVATHSPLRAVEQPPVLETLRRALPEYREVVIEEPGCLDGGDVLHMGQRWYVGLTARTNRKGFEQFQSAVETLGQHAFAVEVHDMLHLKTGVSRLDQETILALPWLAETFRGLGYRALVVDPEDWHAANVLSVGRTVLLPAGYPRVRDTLANHGFNPLEVDLSEFKKQDGGASCLSILLP